MRDVSEGRSADCGDYWLRGAVHDHWIGIVVVAAAKRSERIAAPTLHRSIAHQRASVLVSGDDLLNVAEARHGGRRVSIIRVVCAETELTVFVSAPAPKSAVAEERAGVQVASRYLGNRRAICRATDSGRAGLLGCWLAGAGAAHCCRRRDASSRSPGPRW